MGTIGIVGNLASYDREQRRHHWRRLHGFTSRTQNRRYSVPAVMGHAASDSCGVAPTSTTIRHQRLTSSWDAGTGSVGVTNMVNA